MHAIINSSALTAELHCSREQRRLSPQYKWKNNLCLLLTLPYFFPFPLLFRPLRYLIPQPPFHSPFPLSVPSPFPLNFLLFFSFLLPSPVPLPWPLSLSFIPCLPFFSTFERGSGGIIPGKFLKIQMLAREFQRVLKAKFSTCMRQISYL